MSVAVFKVPFKYHITHSRIFAFIFHLSFIITYIVKDSMERINEKLQLRGVGIATLPMYLR